MESVIIIGSGPAGLTAGLYAARAGARPLVLEGLEPGGQLLQTQHVANFPGFPGTVTGEAVISTLRRQAEAAGARFALDAVERVDFASGAKRLFTLMGDALEARTVIVATGAGVRKTGLPGEAAYWGRGISACLVCDGAFYAGRRVVVVGEGVAARGAGRYLARCGAEVVATCPPGEVASFAGDGTRLTGVVRRDGAAVPCDGLFLVTARVPQTAFLGAALARDANGYISVSDTETSAPGVFAAGDCARPRHKQAVIAAGDGARAALGALEFLTIQERHQK